MSNIIISPQSGILEFNTGAASGSAFDGSLSGAARLKFESSGVLGLTSLGTGVTDKFTIDGSNGRLFTVNNTVTGSIFSVNDVAGLPIVEVFSDDRVVMGKYATDALVVSGSGVSFANVPTVSGNPVMTGANPFDEDTLATVTARGATTTSSIHLDSDSAQLQFGDANNMQIFHNSAKGEINVAAGNFDIDSAGEIILDADTNGVIRLKDGGTEFGKISQNSNNLRIFSSISDGDILLQGNDGGSTITAVTIDMSEGGNVGIGTNSPSEKLEVSGNLKISSNGVGNSASSHELIFFGTTSSASQTDQAAIFSSPWATNTNGGELIFETSNSSNNLVERMRIDGQGFVGIGTTNPQAKLHVDGDVIIDTDTTNKALYVTRLGSTSESLKINVDDSSAIFEVIQDENSAAYGNYHFKTDVNDNTTYYRYDVGGSEVMRLTATGLQIKGNQDTDHPRIHFQASDNSNRFTIETDLDSTTSNDTLGFVSNFGTAFKKDILFLKSNGNVGIGTNNAGEKLAIRSSNSDCVLVLSASDSTTHNSTIKFGDNDSSNRGIIQYAHNGDSMRFTTAGTEAVRIDSSQRVGIGTTAPSYKLEIDGGDFLVNTTNGGYFQVDESDNSVKHSDNIIAKFGTHNDLHIYHSSSDNNNYIESFNGRNLMISSNGISLKSAGGENMITATANGAVKLNYDNNISLETVVGGVKLNSRHLIRNSVVTFANGVANQKVDLFWTGTQVFWGEIIVTVTSTYSHQNAAGSITKKFYVGLNANNTIFTNECRYTDAGGDTADNFAISDLRWDSTNSRYYITIVHRVSTGNQIGIKVEAYAKDFAHIDNIDDITAGSVYTTDTTTYAKPEPYYKNKLGIGVSDPDATLEVKGTGNTNATTSFVVRDSDDAVLLKARNDGVVTVEHNYFYVSSSAGAYVQNNFRVRGSLFNDQGTLQIGNSSGTAFDGDVNFDSNTLFVDSSTNRIGIGTTDPQKQLDLRGDMRLDSAGNTDRSIYFRNQSSIAKVRSDAALQFDVGVSSSPTAAMYIEEDTKNVGIGTINPDALLHVYSAGNGEIEVERNGGAKINLQAQASKAVIGTDSNHQLDLKTNGGARMTLLTNGDVGIGTTAPLDMLHVFGAVRADLKLEGAFQGGTTDVGKFQYAYGPRGGDVNNRNIALISAYNTTTDSTAGGYLSISTRATNSSMSERIRVNQDGQVDIYGNASFAQYLYHKGDEDTNIKFNTDEMFLNVGGYTFFRATETTQNTIKLNSDNEDTDFYLYSTSSTPAIFMRGSDGEVGIGTNNPVQKLQANGSIYAAGGHFFVDNNKSLTSVGDLRLKTNNGTTAVFIDTSQNVGIGTDDPDSKLHVELANAALGFDQGITIQSNPSNFTAGRGGGIIMKNADVTTAGVFGIRETSSFRGALAFYTHTSDVGNTFDTTFTEKMRISSDGNVGIGVTNPSIKLEVNSAGTDEVARFQSTDNDSYISISDNTDAVYIGHDAALDVMSLGFNNSMGVSSNLNIDTDGSVGIGTNNPPHKLSVKGTISRLNSSNIQVINLGVSSEAGQLTMNNAGGVTKALINSNGDSYFNGGDVGIGSASPAEALDVVGLIRFANTRADNTQKIGRLLVPEYNNSHGQFVAFMGTANQTSNAVSYGGGTSSADAATTLLFYTASAVNTTVGTERMRITSAGNVGIGVSSDPSDKLEVNGSFSASSKTFNIEHPTKSGKRLIHGCFEGPEYGVYFRGKTQDNCIKAPEYWSGLVDIDSMTVDITPIGPNQNIYVDRIEDNGDIYVGANTDEPLNYFYVVYGERKDIDKLEIVKDAPVASPNQVVD